MQISNNSDVGSVSIGSINTHEMTISDSSVLFYLLSESLYRMPIKATAREIITNAYDSHIASKNPNPISINLSEDNLIVTDTGGGIPHDLFLKLYGELGSSSKGDDSTQTGGMGIGKLAPLSYTEAFIVENIYNGESRSYSILRGSNETGGRHTIDLLLTIDKPEAESGLTVTIPIKNIGDANDMSRYINKLLIVGNIDATFNNLGKLKYYKPISIKSGFFVLPDRANGLMLKYGNNYYDAQVNISKYTNLSRFMSVNRVTLVIQLEPGTLPITPNREEYIVGERSNDAIHSALAKAENLVTMNRKKLVQRTHEYNRENIDGVLSLINDGGPDRKYSDYYDGDKRADLVDAINDPDFLIDVSAIESLIHVKDPITGIPLYSGNKKDTLLRHIEDTYSIRDTYAKTAFTRKIDAIILKNKINTKTFKVSTPFKRQLYSYRLDFHADFLLAERIIVTHIPSPVVLKKEGIINDTTKKSLVLYIPKRVNLKEFISDIEKVTNKKVEYVSKTIKKIKVASDKPTTTRSAIVGKSMFDVFMGVDNPPDQAVTDYVVKYDNVRDVSRVLRHLGSKQIQEFVTNSVKEFKLTDDETKKITVLNYDNIQKVLKRVKPPKVLHIGYEHFIQSVTSLIKSEKVAYAIRHISYPMISDRAFCRSKMFTHKKSYMNIIRGLNGLDPVKLTDEEADVIYFTVKVKNEIYYGNQINTRISNMFPDMPTPSDRNDDHYKKQTYYLLAAQSFTDKAVLLIKNS